MQFFRRFFFLRLILRLLLKVFGGPDKEAKLIFVLQRIKLRLLAPTPPDLAYPRNSGNNSNNDDGSSVLGPDTPRMFHHSPSRGPQNSSSSSSTSTTADQLLPSNKYGRGFSADLAAENSTTIAATGSNHLSQTPESLLLPPSALGVVPSTSVSSNADSDSSATSSVASLSEHLGTGLSSSSPSVSSSVGGGDRSSSSGMSLGAAALLSVTEAAAAAATSGGSGSGGTETAASGGNRDSVSRDRDASYSSMSRSRDRGLRSGNFGNAGGISMATRRVLETNGQKLREVLRALVSIGANLAQASKQEYVIYHSISSNARCVPSKKSETIAHDCF